MVKPGRDQRQQRAEHQPVEALRYEIRPVDHVRVLRTRCRCRQRTRGCSAAAEREAMDPPAARRRVASSSGVVAELAAEGVGLLHQRLARNDFEDLPVVLLVLHVLGRLALDDDDRADELVVFLAEVDLADGRVELLALLVLLDDVRRIERCRLPTPCAPRCANDM